jgi:hypothetical protein
MKPGGGKSTLQRGLSMVLAVVWLLAGCDGATPTSAPPPDGEPGAGLAAQLDAYLTEKGSPLAGHGKDFVASGQKHNVDPRLIVAIAGAESTFGQRICAEYNAWNWFYNDYNNCPVNSFDSWAEGIESVSRGIGGPNYVGGNATTIEAIAQKYTATERDIWISNVTLFYHDELGGDLSNLHFKESDLSLSGVSAATAEPLADVDAPGQVLGTSTQAGGLDGFGMGSSTHLRVGATELAQSLTTQQSMGVLWIREEIPWEEVEEPKGSFRWQYGFKDAAGAERPRDFDRLMAEAAAHNMKVVAMLAYRSAHYANASREEFVAAWEAYVRAVVNKYGDRVDYWEILNEENSRFFWGKVVPGGAPDAAAYALLLRVAHDVIKAHNPNDVVVLGGLAGFSEDLDDCTTNYFAYLRALHEQGAWDVFDVVAVHPYRNEGDSPEAVIPRGKQCPSETPVQYKITEEVAALNQLVESLGAKPIWVTEIGWNLAWLKTRAEERGSSTSAIRADYLVRTYAPLLAAGVEKVFWYSQHATAEESEKGWAVDAEAQQAFQVMAALLTGSTPLGQVRGQDDHGGPQDDDVYEYRFGKDGRTIIVLWKARGGDVPRTVTIANLPDGTVRQIDSRDTSLIGQPLAQTGGGVQVELTERPIYLVVEPSSPPPGGGGWDEFWAGIAQWLEQLWQSILTRIQEAIDQAVRNITDAIAAWVEQELERAWNEFWQNLCGAAALGPLLVGGWAWRRRVRKRN